uniref:NADPH oxidase activator 1 n=1 Tax=Pavo cristatus TaxID=9049 RepID=A0A8C9ELM2_PAVCR
MAYRELLRRWHQAVLAADSGDWDAALETFCGIEEPPARICFNVGCVHLRAGRLRDALRAFDKTVTKDNSLAVGYFQRGFVCLQLEMYEEALSDYHMAFSHLRKNPFIDYKQLGLRHILYAWEVLYSTAAAQCRLQQWQEARDTLEKAVVWRPEGRSAMLALALERVQVRLPLWVPGEVLRAQADEPKIRICSFMSLGFLVYPPVSSPDDTLTLKQDPVSASSRDRSSLNNQAVCCHISLQIPLTHREALSGTDRPAVLRVRCECTVVVRAGEVPSVPALRALLRERFGQQAERGRLRYGDLQHSLCTLSSLCLAADSDSHSGRPILYRMLAQHSYPAQGPGDLEFSKGDVLDILSEVNEDWLEGHCNGKTGIFPKCFCPAKPQELGLQGGKRFLWTEEFTPSP